MLCVWSQGWRWLRAGAAALFLLLLASGTAMAMENHQGHLDRPGEPVVTGVQDGAPAPQGTIARTTILDLMMTVADADCHQEHHAIRDSGMDARARALAPCDCTERCACGCAQVCAVHLLTGLPVTGMLVPQPLMMSARRYFRDDALLGRHPEPGLRPPLFG